MTSETVVGDTLASSATVLMVEDIGMVFLSIYQFTKPGSAAARPDAHSCLRQVRVDNERSRPVSLNFSKLIYASINADRRLCNLFAHALMPSLTEIFGAHAGFFPSFRQFQSSRMAGRLASSARIRG
jgi:hypothetical protein